MKPPEPASYRRGGRAGFSLIEVLCAILILGIGVVGLTEGITVALRSGRDSERLTAAVLCASEVLETLRAEGYLVDGVVDGDCGPGLAGYRWRRTIGRTDLEGLHDVLVAVEEERSGRSVCEVRTLLFEAPGGGAVGDAGRDAAADRGRRREGGR